MPQDESLYESWIVSGSYFNRMLDCGPWYNQWVEVALTYLPRDVLEENKEQLLFVAMGQRDGTRLVPDLCKNREIIVLSERILPP